MTLFVLIIDVSVAAFVDATIAGVVDVIEVDVAVVSNNVFLVAFIVVVVVVNDAVIVAVVVAVNTQLS